MIYLNKIVKTVLMMCVLCILLIRAMKHINNDNKDLTISQQISSYEKCKAKMKEIFKISLDSPPINFVKYAIKNLLLESGINTLEMQENMGVDVKEYYESFEKALSAENLRTKQEFCLEFSSDPSKVKMMTEFLYERQKYEDQIEFSNILRFQFQTPEDKNEYCLKFMLKFGRTKEDHLYVALYLRRQIDLSYPTEEGYYNRPDTYEYHFLDDIAERVKINGTFFGPDSFCAQKYLFKRISEASTSSSSSQANH